MRRTERNDWRQDNRETARLLAQRVAEWRASRPDPTEKVVVVAHSMGGLVCRLFLSQHGGDEVVERAIYLGTPHQGSTRALRTLIIGEATSLGFVRRRVRAILSGFPSSYQLLPTYAAARLPTGEVLDPFASDAWLDPEHRPHHHAAVAFRRMLDSEVSRVPVPVTSIFGYGQNTLEALSLQRRSTGGLLWERDEISIRGDGYVLEPSAVLKDSEIHPVRQQHGALYADADVQRRLRFELVER